MPNNCSLSTSYSVAGAPGFEPGITGPKPVALPLGHAPMKAIFADRLRLQEANSRRALFPCGQARRTIAARLLGRNVGAVPMISPAPKATSRSPAHSPPGQPLLAGQEALVYIRRSSQTECSAAW